MDISGPEEANHFWFAWASKGKIRKRLIEVEFSLRDELSEVYESIDGWRSRMGWAVHPSYAFGMLSVFDYDSSDEIRDIQYLKPWAMGASTTIKCLMLCWGSLYPLVEKHAEKNDVLPEFPTVSGDFRDEVLCGEALSGRRTILGRMAVVSNFSKESDPLEQFNLWLDWVGGVLNRAK